MSLESKVKKLKHASSLAGLATLGASAGANYIKNEVANAPFFDKLFGKIFHYWIPAMDHFAMSVDKHVDYEMISQGYMTAAGLLGIGYLASLYPSRKKK